MVRPPSASDVPRVSPRHDGGNSPASHRMGHAWGFQNPGDATARAQVNPCIGMDCRSPKTRVRDPLQKRLRDDVLTSRKTS